MIDVWGVDRPDLVLSKGFADGLGRLGRKAGKKAVQGSAQKTVPKAAQRTIPRISAERTIPSVNQSSPRAPMEIGIGNHTASTHQMFGRSAHDPSPYNAAVSYGVGPGRNILHSAAPTPRPHPYSIPYKARANIPGHTAPPRSGGPTYKVRRSSND